MFKLLVCFAALFPLSAFVQAQAPTPPSGFSGTYISLAGDTVTLQGKDGKTFTVELTPGWTVSVNRQGTAADLRPGMFVATQNVPVDEQTGRSTEIRVLEPGYRPEEGTHPVSATNANMMTHGTVKTVNRTDGGVELQVTYPSGSRRIVVETSVPVTVSDPVEKSALKPGVAVSGVTRVGSDGVQRASRIQLTKP